MWLWKVLGWFLNLLESEAEAIKAKYMVPLSQKEKKTGKEEEVSGAFLDLFQDSFLYLMSNGKIGAWEPSTGLTPADISCHLQPAPIFCA